MVTKTLLTGEDLLRMPDDGKRYELVRGEVIEITPPGETHGVLASRIDRLSGEFVEEHDLGTVGVESGFYLERNPDTVRGPDVWFISKDRLDPDRVIEGYCEIGVCPTYPTFWLPRSCVGAHMPVCIPTQERGNEGQRGPNPQTRIG